MRLVTLRAAWLLVFAAVFVLPTYAAEPTVLPSGPGDVYLALGDALVTGYEDPGNNDDQPGYPQVLLKHLRATYPNLQLHTELARNDETSSTMLTERPTISSQITRAREYIEQQRAANRRVGLVTLSIGANDLIKAIREQADPKTTRAIFKANLERICDLLQNALKNRFGVPEGELVVVTLYNPYPDLTFPNLVKSADQMVPDFNEVIKEVAKDRDNMSVADAATMFVSHEDTFIYVRRPYPKFDFLDPELYLKFDFHPRPAGHRAIANSIMTATGYGYFTHMPIIRR